MSLSLATFRARFREFDQVPDVTVSARLAEAEAIADRTVLDASTTTPQGDNVVGLRTAASLRTMQGEHAVGPAEVFEKRAERLERSCATAYRILPGID